MVDLSTDWRNTEKVGCCPHCLTELGGSWYEDLSDGDSIVCVACGWPLKWRKGRFTRMELGLIMVHPYGQGLSVNVQLEGSEFVQFRQNLERFSMLRRMATHLLRDEGESLSSHGVGTLGAYSEDYG